MLAGANIIGGNPANGRVENDYYATNPEAVRKLLLVHPFSGLRVLEPCVGAGHIAKEIKKAFPDANLTCIDIVNRGYSGTKVCDFLSWEDNNDFYDTIITNPPYKYASEFIEHCIKKLTYGGQLAMFLKIQFLEGVKREELFNKYPPKYIYVFRKRMTVFSNGQELNPETGKHWATTMCNAWYVWKKGSKTEPIIRWL